MDNQTTGSARDLYQNRIRGIRDKIGSLQRRMNKYLHNPTIVEGIEIKQSHLRVEMKLLEKKIQIINERYGNAA